MNTILRTLIFSCCYLPMTWADSPTCNIKDVGPRNLGGLERFGEVSPGIYRGSRPPSDEEFRILQSLGIKTIVSFEQMFWHIGPERKRAEKFGIRFIQAAFQSTKKPSQEDVEKALSTLNDPSVEKPLYIHCLKGRDRTGLIVALHRVEHETCSPKDALEEMKRFGYEEKINLHGIQEYIEDHILKQNKESSLNEEHGAQ